MAGLHVVTDARGCARVRFPFVVDGGESSWWQDRAIDAGAQPRWLAPAGLSPVPYALGGLTDALGCAADLGTLIVAEGAPDVIALGHAWPLGGATIALPGTQSVDVDRVARATAVYRFDVLTMVDADPSGGRLRAELGAACGAVGCRVAHLVPPAADMDDWRRSVGDDERWADEVLAAWDAVEWEEVTADAA